MKFEDINRKIFLIPAIISLVFTLITITDTYAKYQTSAEGDSSFSIARWVINVNNQDITSTKTLTNVVTPIFSGSEFVKEGVIAPRSEGYFDISIDSTNVDVSFRYTLSTSTASDSSVSDLKITGYTVNGGDLIPVDGDVSSIGNTISYGSSTLTNLRFYIKWEDGEGESMSNNSDTEASLSGEDAKINVVMSFIQVAE